MIPELIDTHVSFGRWPWQDFSALTPDSLVASLKAEGIAEAWISAVDSIFFPDPDVPDTRLLAAFRPYPGVTPVKTMNPLLGNWRESLKKAVESDGFRLVRILPSYHLYDLIDRPALEFATVLAGYRIPLLIPVRVEDERNQYPLLRVPTLPPDHIAHFAALHAGLKILALGATATEIPSLIAGNTNVLCDIAFAEREDTLKNLTASVPCERLVFGSHTPFFYTRAAVRKLLAAGIDGETRQLIACGNARRFQLRT